MTRLFKYFLLLPMATLPLSFIHCTPAVIYKPPVVETLPGQPVKIIHGDTLHYQIAFTDSRERERFIYGFNRFLKEQSFQTERYDSAGCFTSFKVLPIQNQAETPGSSAENTPAAAPIAMEKPAENKVQRDTAVIPRSDTAQPLCTGALRIYVPRLSIGDPFSAFVDAWPFCERIKDDSLTGYLVVEKAAPSAITLKLAGKVTNGTGRALSALDFVNQWTTFIREHPAEGLALFRWCEGITDFIKGREALIQGLQVPDDKTIRIKLSKADPSAVERLRTIRTLPAGFKLGAYYIRLTRETENALSSNRNALGTKPFLNECLLRTGGDNNPLVSYSLGRYDAMVLSSSADLDYARRNLLKDGTCSMVLRDRYFIANNIGDSTTRAYIRSVVSGGDLLKNFVKAEGAPIQRLETDSVTEELPPVPATAKPTLAGPVSIVFRKDDAISKTIAERLLAALTRFGISGAVTGADEKTYESTLVTRNYTCIVGWVPGSILTDESEKLRLAALYFNDETDEGSRVASSREVPLFSIDWYLLARAKVGLYKGKVSGMFVKQINK